MNIIAAIKNNKVMYGSPEKIALLIGVTGEALRKQIRANNKQILAKNDYVVYLDVERIK